MPDIQLDNRRDGRDRRHGIERQTMAGMAFEANGRRMRCSFLNAIQFGFACSGFLDFAIGTRMKFDDGRT